MLGGSGTAGGALGAGASPTGLVRMARVTYVEPSGRASPSCTTERGGPKMVRPNNQGLHRPPPSGALAADSVRGGSEVSCRVWIIYFISLAPYRRFEMLEHRYPLLVIDNRASFLD